jgi:hypothetical protein
MPTTGVGRRPAAAVAGALAVLAALAGCAPGDATAVRRPIPPAPSATPSDDPAADDGASYNPTDEDEQAIRDLMEARASAVEARDLPAFRATVDQGQPKLLAAQTVLFRNLVALRADTLWYDLATTYGTPAPVPGDDPVLQPQVFEHLKLPATMSSPVANELDLTFVKRGDLWLVGAERAPGAKGSEARPQERPWFGVPIAVRRDGDLTVLVDAGQKDRLAELVEAVQDGVERDADILGVPGETRVLVDATSNGVASDFGAGEESVSAVTFALFADIAVRGEPLVDRAGAAIKLNPKQVEELMSDDRLLWHELTHYLLIGHVGSPVWLREGVASWAEWQPAEMSGLVVPDALYDKLQHAKHELPAASVFYDKPQVDYPIAQAAVQWLVDCGGTAKLLELMAAYGRLVGDGTSDAATGKALRRVYGISEKELVAGTWETLSSLHH